ncbi:hypothetical protein F5879DRAFT_509702 [Lentinula edodes]|nr:hypothetical protein F5879DRAFT_509702 [Lentinula edodes]
MRTHLRNCVHTPLMIRQQADQDARDVKSGKNISTVAPQMDAGPSDIPAIQTPHPTHASTSISSSSSLQLQTGTMPHYSLPTSTLIEPSSPALSAISFAPSDSISQVGSQPGSDIGLDIPHSLCRGLKRNRSSSHQGFHQIPPWTSAQQAQLEDRLTCITASAGFALSWVENPELLAFFQEFLPQAKVPSQKVLTNRLLPKVTQTY